MKETSRYMSCRRCRSSSVRTENIELHVLRTGKDSLQVDSGSLPLELTCDVCSKSWITKTGYIPSACPWCLVGDFQWNAALAAAIRDKDQQPSGG
jgi:hypothetical protein